MNLLILEKGLKYHLKLSNNCIQITHDSLLSMYYVLTFSRGLFYIFLWKFSKSLPTCIQVTQIRKWCSKALTLPNKANAACHGQLRGTTLPHPIRWAAVNKKGKSDVGHAERPCGCPNENRIQTIIWKIGSICVSGHRKTGRRVKTKWKSIRGQ